MRIKGGTHSRRINLGSPPQYTNYLTGFLIFTVPYIIAQPFAKHLCILISVVAVFAALEGLIIHISRDQYCPDVKTLFVKRETDYEGYRNK